MNTTQLDIVLGYLNEGADIDMKKFINEAGKESAGQFTISINNKNYTVYNNDGLKVDDKFKSQVTKEASKLLKNERKIIDQVYKLYEENYGSNYKEDKKKDHIESFELLNPKYYSGKFNLGIFLSNINQYYTMFNNGKIIEKQTYIY
jgi:hypothetical protein